MARKSRYTWTDTSRGIILADRDGKPIGAVTKGPPHIVEYVNHSGEMVDTPFTVLAEAKKYLYRQVLIGEASFPRVKSEKEKD